MHGLIHLRPLTDSVDYAKVWLDKPKPTDKFCAFDEPRKFYFIKNENGIYVAAVLDMPEQFLTCHDLHWYVLPKYRHNGYLTNAMKDVILFHLFQDREIQIITINKFDIGLKNFIASEKVALNLGFVKKAETECSIYALTKDNYQTNKYITGQNTIISEERINELTKQVNFIARSLWMIQTEVEMKLGDLSYADELKELVDEIKKHNLKLDDAWWKSKETN